MSVVEAFCDDATQRCHVNRDFQPDALGVESPVITQLSFDFPGSTEITFF